MIFERMNFIAVLLIMGTSLTLYVTQNWRRYIISLSIQFIAIFWLISGVLPVGLAAVKLIVGWMSGAVLAASQPNSGLEYENGDFLSGNIFRFFSAVLVWIVCFTISPAISTWLSVDLSIIQGALILIGMGLLHLGMTTRPLRVIVALLTLLSGFEIIHSILETSVLVAGLLALTNLGLSLIGSLFLITGESEQRS